MTTPSTMATSTTSLRRLWSSKSRLNGLKVGSALLLTTATVVTLTLLEEEASNHYEPPDSFCLPVDFMDKLAAKPYLHFSGGPADRNTTDHHRPAGIPHRLRLLAVDVPEVRQRLQGDCRVVAERVYPDGLAPPHVVTVDDNKPPTKMEIEQKAWVQSLYQYTKSDGGVGIEVMEASIARLNPHNLRRTRPLGRLRYDLHKSAGSMSIPKEAESSLIPLRGTDEDDESQAPWNQVAWMEEMILRIHGRVEFGAELEPSSAWQRQWWSGRHFQSTTRIGARRRPWSDYVLPWRLLYHEPGLDGEPGTASDNKPHAVIAHGTALQRVPQSLRLLQKTCRDAGVPLFVVQDPRTWGNVPHGQDLGPVLREVRRTVKARLIGDSLQAGTAFGRGRVVGQLEKEVEWQAKSVMRQTKQALKDAEAARKRKADRNWRTLDEPALLHQLARHGVLVQQNGYVRSYTSAMLEIAQQVVAKEDGKKLSKQTGSTQTEESPIVPSATPADEPATGTSSTPEDAT